MAVSVNHVEFASRYPEVVSQIAVEIRSRRMERGWSQGDLARLIGVDHSYISRLESGKRVPSVGMLARLSEALGGEIWTIGVG